MGLLSGRWGVFWTGLGAGRPRWAEPRRVAKAAIRGNWRVGGGLAGGLVGAPVVVLVERRPERGDSPLGEQPISSDRLSAGGGRSGVIVVDWWRDRGRGTSSRAESGRGSAG